MRRPADLCSEFQQLLTAVGIPHAVMGALAALRYRQDPRPTGGVDLLVAHTTGLLPALSDAGYSAVQTVGNPPGAVFLRVGSVQVNLLVAETEYQHNAIERAVDGFLTVEDVVVHKLVAWRPRDRDDIASIFDAGVALDTDYIADWAAAWDVADRWRQVQRWR